MTTNAKHLSKSENHMTPAYIVEPSRRTLGRFDLDPATTAEANELVKAQLIFTPEDDGLGQSWQVRLSPLVTAPSRVFLNPPGGSFSKKGDKPQTIDMRHGYTKSRQALWWMKLMDEYERNNVLSAIFVGFSIELLQVAQQLKCDVPTNFPMCIPDVRIPFDKWGDDGKRVSQRQPGHANVIVLVSDDQEDVERFRKEFRSIGEVFNDK